MSDTKIFSLGEQGNMSGLISALCQNRGVDPNMLAAIMNNNRGGWGDCGAWWIIILLIFGWGGFGNGFGGGFGGRGTAQGLADLGNLVNNDAGRELLMQAIQGNATAISQMAAQTHCDQNALQGAVQNLSTQICQMGNTLGLGQRDIVNAMQNGNTAILSKLCDCCAENRLAICQQTNTLQNAINTVAVGQERGFSSVAYETQKQTCDILGAIDKQTQAMVAQFSAIKEREDQREIQNLRDQVQAYQLSASQQQQTRALIDQLQPCAKPAYITCSPCQSMFGFPYGYPYNNGNCCCNNGCGCN